MHFSLSLSGTASALGTLAAIVRTSNFGLAFYNRSIMKTSQIFIGTICALLTGCFNNDNKQYTPHCKDVDHKNPIITHGFTYSDVDTVVIKTYKKNTNFHDLVEEFYCYQSDYVNDAKRQTRHIDLSKPLKTSYDWQIIIGDKFIYNIDNIRVTSEPQFTMMTQNYECKMSSYRINGKESEAGNIFIQKPGFKYPWE